MPTQRNRFFSSIQNTDKNHGSFSYVWSDAAVITGTANPITGAWIPVSADAAGFINVNAGLQITGSINASISAAVAVTGNPLFTVSNPILPTSGTIQGGNSLPVYVTGTINTVVTGQVSSSVSIAAIAITGNPGFTLTGLNTGLTFPISAPLGIIGIDTGVRAVNVVGGSSGSALGSLDVRNTYLPVSGVGTFGVAVTNSAPINVTGFINTIVTGNIGGSVTVSSVAITGAPVVTITGVLATSTSVVVGNVAVTGGNIGSTSIVAALASGNALLQTANMIGSGISGALTSSLTDAAWVTGQVSIINTAPLNITGIVTTAPAAIQAISGNAFVIVTGFNTGITVNVNSTVLNALAITGNQSVAITGFNSGLFVYTQPVTKTSVSNSTPTGVAPWTGMATPGFMQTGQLGANPNRVMFFIQNIHTGIPTYVALNNNAASTGNFNFILNPSLTQGFGGSSFSDDHYRGFVQISGGAYVAWEI